MPLNSQLDADNVRHVLDDADTSALVVGPGFIDVAREIQRELFDLRYIIAVCEDCDLPVGFQSYGDLLARETREAPSVDPAPDDVARVFYTGGTTGPQKVVMHTHESLVPLVVLFGPGGVLVTQGVFFDGVAAVSFGGAYAALAFVAQQAVDGFGWLSAEVMLDGIGVVEPLPGPLIKIVQFVAFLGAFRNPGGLDPIVTGLLGATVAGWFTYLPSYLWIFVGAPYVEALRDNEALSAVTADVVGVIANLGAWFGVQVLFAERATLPALGARVELPVLATVDPAVAAIAVAAGVALTVLDQPIPRTLAGAAAVGVLLG